ncbi:hypothetical protein FHS16_006373 [Paenibacillus endophyticus]|uniref:Uncharacterized protein n=1 Tax=Paenibacillus endophyticus TaxID=1294268 RepID=A0A7W5GDU1_9BACL|nr:hypothetical protein [Paenibacillus endophyticus]
MFYMFVGGGHVIISFTLALPSSLIAYAIALTTFYGDIDSD